MCNINGKKEEIYFAKNLKNIPEAHIYSIKLEKPICQWMRRVAVDSLCFDAPSVWILLQRWMPQKCLATVSQHASQQPCSPVQWIHIRQISMCISLGWAFHLLQGRCFHWSNGEHVHSWSFNLTVCLISLCNCFFSAYFYLLVNYYLSHIYHMLLQYAVLKEQGERLSLHDIQAPLRISYNACCRSLSTHFLRSPSCLFAICGLSLFAVTQMRCFVVRNEVLFCTALSLLKILSDGEL